MHSVYVFLLQQLPVANFGQQKVAVTHLCTFDHHFCMAELGRTVMGGVQLLAVEAMLGVFFEGDSRVIYCSLYVGLSDVGHNFEEAIFLMSNSKSRVLTTSTILRQLILHYEDSVCNPQTLVLLES
jgi:hypothetical protein